MAAILEGAAQILEAGGLAAFTTNAVAERAGVSIGTLYQYFADKNAILLALAKQRDRARPGGGRTGAARRGRSHARAGRVRAMVRAIVHAFHGRLRARKAVMQAVLAQGLNGELMVPVVAFIARHGPLVGLASQPVFAALTPLQLFVMSRAMIGVVRAAVLEEQPFFKSRAFEDELVRLVLAYLSAVTAKPSRRGNRPVIVPSPRRLSVGR